MLPYRLYHFWRLALLPSLLINAETLLRVPQGKEERVKVGGAINGPDKSGKVRTDKVSPPCPRAGRDPADAAGSAADWQCAS